MTLRIMTGSIMALSKSFPTVIIPIKSHTTCSLMGLYHPLDGHANLKYKLLGFLTHNKKNLRQKTLGFKGDRCCHLALCLWLILFHSSQNDKSKLPYMYGAMTP
jgi:hypothetical protein